MVLNVGGVRQHAKWNRTVVRCTPVGAHPNIETTLMVPPRQHNPTQPLRREHSAQLPFGDGLARYSVRKKSPHLSNVPSFRICPGPSKHQRTSLVKSIGFPEKRASLGSRGLRALRPHSRVTHQPLGLATHLGLTAKSLAYQEWGVLVRRKICGPPGPLSSIPPA